MRATRERTKRENPEGKQRRAARQSDRERMAKDFCSVRFTERETEGERERGGGREKERERWPQSDAAS